MITPEQAIEGLIAIEDATGHKVKLDAGVETFAWQCAVWWNGGWAYMGDKFHLSGLTAFDGAEAHRKLAPNSINPEKENK